jgi:hypothetical protein
MLTARPSANEDEIVIEVAIDGGAGVMHLRLTVEGSKRLRGQLQDAENVIGKRQSARGEHPIY